MSAAEIAANKIDEGAPGEEEAAEQEVQDPVDNGAQGAEVTEEVAEDTTVAAVEEAEPGPVEVEQPPPAITEEPGTANPADATATVTEEEG